MLIHNTFRFQLWRSGFIYIRGLGSQLGSCEGSHTAASRLLCCCCLFGLFDLQEETRSLTALRIAFLGDLRASSARGSDWLGAGYSWFAVGSACRSRSG